MKKTRLTALAAVTVAAALSLTACGGQDSGSGTSSKGSAASNSSSSSAASKGGSGEDIKAEAAGNAQKAGARITFCRTADLAIDARDAAPDENTGRIDITMVNRGSKTCSATGFPGVDIKDADGTSSSTQRGQAQPRVTTLKPGQAAVANLAYDIDHSGESMSDPTHILVTPPNETHTVTLKWPAGAGAIKGIAADVQVYPTHNVN
ncbi:hypothetical protein DEJ49_15230 [Streptomyces venezuelae]|uniref:DUF4232 domain-containing protein n=1 Tax=Streptomyces venezuelae TaxID=54571 RepID=A0A5P2CH55_STRVZ|nr:DUF4232 domain-containing protein [Streptomyces venezuelae]QES42162.1 hypothetical protein DEJ49_15230 [Streptomyces venezuelae]